MNIIKSIIDWFKIAKSEPTIQDQIRQTAYHVDEFAEMMEAIGRVDMRIQAEQMRIKLLAIASQSPDEFIGQVDDVALLDALCDQIVTAIGVGVLMGYDMENALAEVNRSNYTKFNADGTPYIRPDGKIGKNPETYQEPQLEPFTGDLSNYTLTGVGFEVVSERFGVYNLSLQVTSDTHAVLFKTYRVSDSDIRAIANDVAVGIAYFTDELDKLGCRYEQEKLVELLQELVAMWRHRP